LVVGGVVWSRRFRDIRRFSDSNIQSVGVPESVGQSQFSEVGFW
jgi:hypothetical protein